MYLVNEINITILAVIQHWEIVYLEQLVWLKVLILMSTNILDMALDLLENEIFHLVMDLVEIVQFFVLIWVFLYMLITRKKKLILGEVPTQGLDGTTLIEKKYSHILLKIMFICLIVIFIYCINSYLFVNGIELLNLKQKIQQKDWDSETDIVTTQWCLQNISKDFCK